MAALGMVLLFDALGLLFLTLVPDVLRILLIFDAFGVLLLLLAAFGILLFDALGI